eukprot:TRINITY_DN2259_c0_g1_i1.p1 TRINITY_DN2259_c0_g1~~TRINITY_DN2259_c0_g1_i1.p1  ORF type:complete len:215 (+),score=54.38 TRINITY_DN2259_c0_g1_i1:86-730(+)
MRSRRHQSAKESDDDNTLLTEEEQEDLVRSLEATEHWSNIVFRVFSVLLGATVSLVHLYFLFVFDPFTAEEPDDEGRVGAIPRRQDELQQALPSARRCLIGYAVGAAVCLAVTWTAIVPWIPRWSTHSGMIPWIFRVSRLAAGAVAAQWALVALNALRHARGHEHTYSVVMLSLSLALAPVLLVEFVRALQSGHEAVEQGIDQLKKAQYPHKVA